MSAHFDLERPVVLGRLNSARNVPQEAEIADVMSVLPAINCLKSLSVKEQKLLAYVTVPVAVSASTVLFHAGDLMHGLYLVKSGSIRLYTPEKSNACFKSASQSSTSSSTDPEHRLYGKGSDPSTAASYQLRLIAVVVSVQWIRLYGYISD